MFDVPETEILFPCVKRLDLLSVVYTGRESFEDLISGCPVLEELFVERHIINDNLGTTLKRLHISCSPVFIRISKADIYVPKLEYLSIVDFMSSKYYISKPFSLIEAHISLSDVYAPDQLVARLTNAKRLTLTSRTLDGFSLFRGFYCPVFPNLVKLVIGIDCVKNWTMMLYLLTRMPNLEHITFSEGISRGSWDPPMRAPDCLIFQMKEIIILNPKAVISEEFVFIRFLLENSNNLEIFTINTHDIHPNTREQLLNFHRASNLCRFEFV